jgi:hypothetical protein
LRVGVTAHAIYGARGAGSDGVGVATGVFCSDGDRTVGTADDRTLMIEGIGFAEVDDEPSIFGTTHKGDCGANLDAEDLVRLGVRNTGGRGGQSALTAPDVDGARRRGRPARVLGRTNTGGIRSRANVTLNFLLGILANQEACQQKGQDQQTTDSCQIAMNLHGAPRPELVLPTHSSGYYAAHAAASGKGCDGTDDSEIALLQLSSLVPIDNIHELPRILVELELELPFFVYDQLGRGVEESTALVFVGIVNFDLTRRQVVCCGLRIVISFTESDHAVGDEANLSARWRWDEPDETEVVANRAGDRDTADGLHLRKGIYQALILSLLEGINEDLPVFVRRVLVDDHLHADVLSQLGTCTHSRCVDSLY